MLSDEIDVPLFMISAVAPHVTTKNPICAFNWLKPFAERSSTDVKVEAN
jgi:hypothetical protein